MICTGEPEATIARTSSTVTDGRSANCFCSSGRGAATWRAFWYRASTAAQSMVAHERGNVGARIRAELQVIGMLVHVESKDRNGACDGLAVIRARMADQTAVSRDVAQKHPSGASGEPVRECAEFAAPIVD